MHEQAIRSANELQVYQSQCAEMIADGRKDCLQRQDQLRKELTDKQSVDDMERAKIALFVSQIQYAGLDLHNCGS